MFQILPEPFFIYHYSIKWAPLVVQTVKDLPAMQVIQAQSLGWEDPLEKGGYALQHSCLENSTH